MQFKKLTELLVIEKEVRGKFVRILQESAQTFKHKFLELYTGEVDSLEYFNQEDQAGNTTTRKEITDSVPDKLQYTADAVTEYIDIILKKELANQNAKSDLIIDGLTLGKALPATLLLALESRLSEVRNVLVDMPTLPDSVSWIPDPSKGPFVFKSEHPVERFKTKKIVVPFVLHAPTKEHPAIVEKLTEEKNVGKYTKTMWDSRVTSARKSEILKKMDAILAAVKVAREKANVVDIDNTAELGEKIVDYVLK